MYKLPFAFDVQGTHFLNEIIKALQLGNVDKPANMFNAWINVRPWHTIVELQTAPRLMLTHLPLSYVTPTLRYVMVIKVLNNSKANLYKKFYYST